MILIDQCACEVANEPQPAGASFIPHACTDGHAHATGERCIALLLSAGLNKGLPARVSHAA